MNIFTINAKFLGGQVEFGVGDHEQYTLAHLWADVYMYCCSTMPNPSERFKVEVKLATCKEFKVGDDKELQHVFRMFKEKGIHSIRFDFELLPYAAFTPEEIIRSRSTSSDGDEDYIPHSNSRGSTGGSQEDNSGYLVDGVEPAANEEASVDDYDDMMINNCQMLRHSIGTMVVWVMRPLMMMKMDSANTNM